MIYYNTKHPYQIEMEYPTAIMIGEGRHPFNFEYMQLLIDKLEDIPEQQELWHQIQPQLLNLLFFRYVTALHSAIMDQIHG